MVGVISSDLESLMMSSASIDYDIYSTGIQILERSVYRGPNLYSRLPMVRIRVDLGALEQRPTNTIPEFSKSLLEILPGIARHHCSRGIAGGLVERMEEGTWLGHVAEHVAIELQCLAGASVTRGKTRSVRGRIGVYDILFEYRDEQAGFLAGLHALRTINGLLPSSIPSLQGEAVLPISALDKDADIAAVVTEIRQALRRSALGPSTKAIVDAARKRGIPTIRLNDQSLIQLGYGRRQHRIRASITAQTPHIAVELAGNKQQARQLLLAAGLPTPHGSAVRTLEEAAEATSRLRAPWVVKPIDANHGRGVTVNLTSADEIAVAFKAAKLHSARVIIEEQLIGEDYRFLVVAGQVVAVARRQPAAVLGDGVSDIATLIARENLNPRRGSGHENVLTRLTLDAAAERVLAAQGFTSQSVPCSGQSVQLQATANLSTGGTAEDCTDEVHPDNIFIAEQAAAIVGLDVAGIDLIAQDIARPVGNSGGGIVEINAAPGLRMHLSPSGGEPRDVAGPIVDSLFPKSRPSRIPIIAITGTNGKSTTARMVAKILRHSGLQVGLTTTTGVYIGERLIRAADASGPKSARMILSNPTVDVAVLETARGGILREGLGFDRCDVGCVLNVTEDHLGIKGINTVEDLARVKSVVVESVARRGWSVLNADDLLTRRMAKRAGGRICWFSNSGRSRFIDEHLAADGMAVLREIENDRDSIILYKGHERVAIVEVSAIPATQEGAAAFNTENAIAATAIAIALNVEAKAIGAALQTFTTTFEESPGRLNVIERGGVTVIVDYAHNPAAVTALGKYLLTLRRPGRRVIGTFSVPGDRRDEDLIGMGTLAASIFDELVFRETPDGRGRPQGEINAMMSQGAFAGGLPAERIHRVVEEGEATSFSLSLARQGDVVVLSPTQIEMVWDIVNRFVPSWSSLDELNSDYD